METETPQWGPVKRMLFRFGFVYFLLYLLPFPLNAIPYTYAVAEWWEQKLWDVLVTWTGWLVFKIDITVLPNGSGDTTWNYVQVFCCFVFALAAAGIWTLLDRDRPNYKRLHEGLRIYVRFALAAAMITYGAVKIFKSQFAGPTLDRLLQPFGEASPMGLLWTFMAASESYNLFTGLGEMLGGLLLVARRTTLLGALVCIGVMSNVVMLNFSYDVPVKLYSSHLLAMAVFLTLPDLRRLVDFFVLDRPVEPAGVRPLFQRKGWHHGALVLRTVFIAGFAGLSLFGAWQATKTRGSLAPKAPFHGIWNVEELEVDGQVRPPLLTDGERWRRVVFDRPKTLAVLLMSDSREYFALDLDTARKTMALSKRDDPAWKATFSYEQPAPGNLRLAGTLDGRKVRARLRRVDESGFLLLSRGFHWINEYPYNR